MTAPTLTEDGFSPRSSHPSEGTEATVVTPRIRQTLARASLWIGAFVFVLIVAVGGLLLTGTAVDGPPLDPTSPREAGTLAVVEVLRQQGVTVVTTTTLEETREALDSSRPSTLFFANLEGYLTDQQVAATAKLAPTVIFAEPLNTELKAMAPELASASAKHETIGAQCSSHLVDTAPSITVGPSTVRITDYQSDAVGCYGDNERGYGMVIVDRNETNLIVLGATEFLTNGAITSADNAALALRLLGQHDTLVWYTPSFADLAATSGAKSFDELSPDWVAPVVWLIMITLLTAALWRGRRFGPLAIEKLPVTVRSSETMQGRARLYEQTGARLHTLDALRIGALRRLAAHCGLASTASVDDVVLRVATLTGEPSKHIRNLLVDSSPQSDHELISLSDALLELEHHVRDAIRPS